MKKAIYLERYEWGYVAEAVERAATANPADCTITHVGRAELRRIAKILRDASIPPRCTGCNSAPCVCKELAASQAKTGDDHGTR